MPESFAVDAYGTIVAKSSGPVLTDADLPKTRTRDAGATKARILEAAKREFAKNGLAGARVDVIAEKAKAAGHAADDYVHDHPWQSVGVAAGVGLLLGMLLSRR